jgi:photosystem II stability/assembly factor-like uncharacterized protein
VSAADTTHVWAVGSNEKPGVAPESNTGLVYSFDGKAWRLQQEVAEQLHKVAAVGAAGAWAAGGIGDNGPVYHFDGRKWTRQFDARESLFDITACDAHHAWAVGGLGGIFVFEDTLL